MKKPTIKGNLQWLRINDIKTMVFKKPIILLNGAFDLLHSGHLKLIFIARKQGKTLVCAMDSDERVRKAKGEGRPILSWVERATAMRFTPVDYLIEINSDEEMEALLGALQPDLRVQGMDYEGVESKYPQYKKMFVDCGGMRTEEIVKRCKKATCIIKDVQSCRQ